MIPFSKWETDFTWSGWGVGIQIDWIRGAQTKKLTYFFIGIGLIRQLEITLIPYYKTMNQTDNIT